MGVEKRYPKRGINRTKWVLPTAMDRTQEDMYLPIFKIYILYGRIYLRQHKSPAHYYNTSFVLTPSQNETA